MEARTRSPRPRAPAAQAPAKPAIAGLLEAPGYAGWLLIAVLCAVVYAVFANAATLIGDESRVQLALGGIGLLAGVGLVRGELGAARSPLAWGGAALIACFAVYCVISELWSIAPDESWTAANRAAEYAALVAIVLLAAPSVVRAPEKGLFAILGLAGVVALYALGGKIAPTLSFGPIDLDHASQFARLRAPLGYWNALGMLLTLATPACLWVAADRERSRWGRLAAVLLLEVLLVAIALTYSRGAIVALAVAIGVMVLWGEQRGRVSVAAALAIAAAAVPVGYAFSSDQLTSDGVPAADRAGEGGVLALVLAGTLLVLAAVVLWAIRNEPDRLSRRRRRGLKRLGKLILAVGAIVVLGSLATSERGLTGTVSHQWDQFRRPVGVANDPSRLLSSNSSNRWIWWQEAAGAFSDHPFIGTGAGSFPVIHNQYMEHRSQVRSAHSVPLQFLAEGGLFGAALAIGGVALLFAAALKTVRTPKVVGRGARIALIAGAAAWGVHCLIDWDWEIPGVTLVALTALALAAAPWREGRRWLDPSPPADRRRRLNEALALPTGVIAMAVAVAFAVSSDLPARAEHKRRDALTKAALADPGDSAALQGAIDEARSARRLNPLDEEIIFSEADMELRAGRVAVARALLVQAARRQPDNFRVWDRLLEFASDTGDSELAKTALMRRIETEPLSFAENPDVGAGRVFTVEVPPSQSPTALGTPPEASPSPAPSPAQGGP